MKGRIWLVIGVALGIAVGIGKLAYLSGAAESLTDTALRIVGTADHSIVHSAAQHGASRRVVDGIAALLSVLLPGITALLLMIAARGTLRLRSVIAVLILALGIAAFVYLPAGPATGVALLALAVAAIAVVATGPLVAAPLAAVAALIGTDFLPRILSINSSIPGHPVSTLHYSLFASDGSPLWLRIALIVIAAIPFAVAARIAFR
jgi:hypothetical protein